MMQLEKKLHILIVDDDPEIGSLLSAFLMQHHIQSTIALNIKEAEEKFKFAQFDLMVLDLMMPGEDGLSFCKRWRDQSQIPIIMLTALGEETDRIIGLEIGADDYLSKPFNPRELLARIRAVLRRFKHIGTQPTKRKNELYVFDGWKLNPVKRELYNSENVLVTLTSGEFDLLQTFVMCPQCVLSRDQLLELTKGRDSIPFDRSIDVQLSRLRHKIEIEPKQPAIIKTIRNNGYIFTIQVEKKLC